MTDILIGATVASALAAVVFGAFWVDERRYRKAMVRQLKAARASHEKRLAQHRQNTSEIYAKWRTSEGKLAQLRNVLGAETGGET